MPARRVRIQHRRTVDPLHQNRADPSSADQFGQGRRRRLMGVGVVGETQQRTPAALEEPGQLPVDENDQRPGFAARPAGTVVVCCAGRPRQRCAVRVGRVSGGQHHRPVLGALRVHIVEVAAEPVHCRGDRELRTAQRFDEIPALAAPGVFQRRQHFVQGGEPAGDFFGGHRAAGQHAVPAQQQFSLVMRPHGGIRLGSRQR